MRVSVHRERCRKCGLCSAICPEIFEMDRNHLARVKHVEVPPIGDLQEYCAHASFDCPAGAIEITGPVDDPVAHAILELQRFAHYAGNSSEFDDNLPLTRSA